MDKKIVKNIAQCVNCDDIIESNHVHDYKKCKCGLISVDGGNEYLKRTGYPLLIKELSIFYNSSEVDNYSSSKIVKLDNNSNSGIIKQSWSIQPRRYSSISNVSTLIINKVKNIEISDWVIEEKVHGANLGIHYNKGQVRFASRNQWITNHQKFNRLDLIKDYLELKIKKLAKCLGKDYIIIYGEICGNGYPGYKQNPEDNIKYVYKPVQKEIYYSHKPEFYAFDIYVEDDSIDSKYLHYPIRNLLLDKIGLFRGKEIFKGSLQECLDYDIENMVTTLPLRLNSNYKQIENNYAEGVIIRPIKECRLIKGDLCSNTGTGKQLMGRVILKHKRYLCSEVKPKNKNIKTNSTFPSEIVDLIEEVKTYITLNRLNNIKSHDTIDYNKNFGTKMRLAGLLVQDAIEEYQDDNDINIKAEICRISNKIYGPITERSTNQINIEKRIKKYLNNNLLDAAKELIF